MTAFPNRTATRQIVILTLLLALLWSLAWGGGLRWLSEPVYSIANQLLSGLVGAETPVLLCEYPDDNPPTDTQLSSLVSDLEENGAKAVVLFATKPLLLEHRSELPLVVAMSGAHRDFPQPHPNDNYALAVADLVYGDGYGALRQPLRTKAGARSQATPTGALAPLLGIAPAAASRSA